MPLGYEMIRRKFMAAYIVMLLFLSGCSLDGTSEKKITKKVDFEVCSYNKLPTELLKIIDEKKSARQQILPYRSLLTLCIIAVVRSFLSDINIMRV